MSPCELFIVHPIGNPKSEIKRWPKATLNKTQAVRDYLAAHAAAMPKDVIAALAEQGTSRSWAA